MNKCQNKMLNIKKIISTITMGPISKFYWIHNANIKLNFFISQFFSIQTFSNLQQSNYKKTLLYQPFSMLIRLSRCFTYQSKVNFMYLVIVNHDILIEKIYKCFKDANQLKTFLSPIVEITDIVVNIKWSVKSVFTQLHFSCFMFIYRVSFMK